MCLGWSSQKIYSNSLVLRRLWKSSFFATFGILWYIFFRTPYEEVSWRYLCGTFDGPFFYLVVIDREKIGQGGKQ